MKLSDRLETIIAMVPSDCDGASETAGAGMCAADIGTDHGFVPIRLIQDGKAARALAMDVRSGPLERAKEHIAACGLGDRIETRLSDGLEKLQPQDADGVVIAGMGGDLMLRILKAGDHVRDSIRWWVLSPQSELSLFRHGLEELNLKICEERMLVEDGKYYTVMLVRPGRMHYTEEYEYRYGAYLIQHQSPVLKNWLEKEREQLLAIRGQLKGQTGESAVSRCREIEADLAVLEAAYEACGHSGR
jgi:tRNA (adenine22-N1)-methyltransferase